MSPDLTRLVELLEAMRSAREKASVALRGGKEFDDLYLDYKRAQQRFLEEAENVAGWEAKA